ncbi:uncharacterized protein LOC116613833 [Nematostella vectensis]|uniref:uncharacterized protein LOC116613833 n=1 Tax=Nematostella vectensis TaxID=45351 RepID=UPI002077878A|nr:uncharacterized protein LOC116613833 [Nematostella vectensis]
MADNSEKEGKGEPLFIFYDSEAANANIYTGDLIEIAAKCHPEIIPGSFSSLINTKQKLCNFALEKCGISQDQLTGKPYLPGVMARFLDWIKIMVHRAENRRETTYYPVLCAHGGYQFDFLILFANLERVGVTREQLMERNLHFADTFLYCTELQEKGEPQLKDIKLSMDGLFKHFYPKEPFKDQHRAMGDVNAMVKIFTKTELKNVLHRIPVSTIEERIQYFLAQSSQKQQQLLLEEKLSKMDECSRNMTTKRLLREGITYDILKKIFQESCSFMDFWKFLKDIGIERKVARVFTSQFGAMGLHNQGALAYHMNDSSVTSSSSNGTSSDENNSKKTNLTERTKENSKSSKPLVHSQSNNNLTGKDAIVPSASRATSSSQAFVQRPSDYAVTTPVKDSVRPREVSSRITTNESAKENTKKVKKPSEKVLPVRSVGAPVTSSSSEPEWTSEDWDSDIKNSPARSDFQITFTKDSIPVSINVDDITSDKSESGPDRKNQTKTVALGQAEPRVTTSERAQVSVGRRAKAKADVKKTLENTRPNGNPVTSGNIQSSNKEENGLNRTTTTVGTNGDVIEKNTSLQGNNAKQEITENRKKGKKTRPRSSDIQAACVFPEDLTAISDGRSPEGASDNNSALRYRTVYVGDVAIFVPLEKGSGICDVDLRGGISKDGAMESGSDKLESDGSGGPHEGDLAKQGEELHSAGDVSLSSKKEKEQGNKDKEANVVETSDAKKHYSPDLTAAEKPELLSDAISTNPAATDKKIVTDDQLPPISSNRSDTSALTSEAQHSVSLDIDSSTYPEPSMSNGGLSEMEWDGYGSWLSTDGEQFTSPQPFPPQFPQYPYPAAMPAPYGYPMIPMIPPAMYPPMAYTAHHGMFPFRPIHPGYGLPMPYMMHQMHPSFHDMGLANPQVQTHLAFNGAMSEPQQSDSPDVLGIPGGAKLPQGHQRGTALTSESSSVTSGSNSERSSPLPFSGGQQLSSPQLNPQPNAQEAKKSGKYDAKGRQMTSRGDRSRRVDQLEKKSPKQEKSPRGKGITSADKPKQSPDSFSEQRPGSQRNDASSSVKTDVPTKQGTADNQKKVLSKKTRHSPARDGKLTKSSNIQEAAKSVEEAPKRTEGQMSRDRKGPSTPEKYKRSNSSKSDSGENEGLNESRLSSKSNASPSGEKHVSKNGSKLEGEKRETGNLGQIERSSPQGSKKSSTRRSLDRKQDKNPPQTTSSKTSTPAEKPQEQHKLSWAELTEEAEAEEARVHQAESLKQGKTNVTINEERRQPFTVTDLPKPQRQQRSKRPGRSEGAEASEEWHVKNSSDSSQRGSASGYRRERRDRGKEAPRPITSSTVTSSMSSSDAGSSTTPLTSLAENKTKAVGKSSPDVNFSDEKNRSRNSSNKNGMTYSQRKLRGFEDKTRRVIKTELRSNSTPNGTLSYNGISNGFDSKTDIGSSTKGAAAEAKEKPRYHTNDDGNTNSPQAQRPPKRITSKR